MDIKQEIITLANTTPVSALDISPDREKLIIGQQGDDFGTVSNLTLWSIPEKKIIKEILHLPDVKISSARFSNNGKTLFYTISPKDHDVHIYNLETQEHLEKTFVSMDVSWLAVAKNANRLVTSGMLAQVWDLDIYDGCWMMEEYIAFSCNNHIPAVADITPDGTKIAVVGMNVNQVYIYDIEQNVIIQTLDEAPKQAIYCCFSPDLRYFAAIGKYGTCFVWDLNSLERCFLDLFPSDLRGDLSLCFHPSGEYLASGTFVGFISIYRLCDSEIIFSEQAHQGRVWCMKFTPDARN
jgi:WD40 repeat protein